MTREIYELRRISGQLEIEVIHAKPVFCNVKILHVLPIVKRLGDIKISGVRKDNDIKMA